MRKRALFVAGVVALGGIGIGATAAMAKGSDDCRQGPGTRVVNYVPVTSDNGVDAGVIVRDPGPYGETSVTACMSTTAPGDETGDIAGGSYGVFTYRSYPNAGGVRCGSNSDVLMPDCGAMDWQVWNPSVTTSGVGLHVGYGWSAGPAVDVQANAPAPSGGPAGTIGGTQTTPCVILNGVPQAGCGVALATATVAPGDVTTRPGPGGLPTGVVLGNDAGNKTVTAGAAGITQSADTTAVVPAGTCVGIC